jgi:ketosteroid isomerase-like protein
MKVKNISGSSLTFGAGKRSHTIANNASVTVGDDGDTLNDVMVHVEAGRLELVGAPPLAHFSGTPSRYGYADLNLNSTLADTDYVTIAGVTFEFDTAASGSITSGRTRVLLSDTSPMDDAETTAAAFKAAINANTTLATLGLVADDVIVISSTNAKVILKATGSTAIADVTITQSGNGVDITKVNASEAVGFRTSVVSATAAASTLLVNTGLESITGFTASVITAGVAKAYDGVATVGGGFIYFNAAGDTDLASGDVVVVTAHGK